MKRFDILGSRSTLILSLSVLALTACAQQPKTTESVSSYKDENGNMVKVTTTKEVTEVNPAGVSTHETVMPPAELSEETTNVDIRDADGNPVAGAYSDETSTHVRAPLVKIDSDENTGRVNVKVPFVSVTKNGHGDKTTVKIPGITIRSNE